MNAWFSLYNLLAARSELLASTPLSSNVSGQSNMCWRVLFSQHFKPMEMLILGGTQQRARWLAFSCRIFLKLLVRHDLFRWHESESVPTASADLHFMNLPFFPLCFLSWPSWSDTFSPLTHNNTWMLPFVQSLRNFISFETIIWIQVCCIAVQPMTRNIFRLSGTATDNCLNSSSSHLLTIMYRCPYLCQLRSKREHLLYKSGEPDWRPCGGYRVFLLPYLLTENGVVWLWIIIQQYPLKLAQLPHHSARQKPTSYTTKTNSSACKMAHITTSFTAFSNVAHQRRWSWCIHMDCDPFHRTSGATVSQL